MKPKNFTAEISGDGECFCFNLNKSDFIKIMGKKRYNEEISYLKSFCKDIKSKFIEPQKFRVYPGQLLHGVTKVNIEINNKSIKIIPI
jgi:hypothetical protein